MNEETFVEKISLDGLLAAVTVALKEECCLGKNRAACVKLRPRGKVAEFYR